MTRALSTGRVLAIAVGAAAALVAPGTPATAGPAPVVAGVCAPARHLVQIDGGATLTGMRTVLATQRIWIARTPGTSGAQLFACWRPTHEARRIGANSGAGAVTDAILADFQVHGRFVAFRTAAGGREQSARWRSFDVREQRFVRDSGKVPTATGGDTGDFAVTTTGALGWLAGGVLHATDADGTRVLAGPQGGRIQALQASGRSLHWMQAGVPASARLR